MGRIHKISTLFGLIAAVLLVSCQKVATEFTPGNPRVYTTANALGTLSAVVRTAENNDPMVSFKLNTAHSPSIFVLYRFEPDKAPPDVRLIEDSAFQADGFRIFNNNGLGEFIDDGSDPFEPEKAKELVLGTTYVYYLVPLWGSDRRDPPGFSDLEARDYNNSNRDSFYSDIGIRGRYSFIFRLEVEIR